MTVQHHYEDQEDATAAPSPDDAATGTSIFDKVRDFHFGFYRRLNLAVSQPEHVLKHPCENIICRGAL